MIGRLARRRRVGAMTLAALAALAFLVATAPHKAATRPPARAAAATFGLQTGPASWTPEYTFLGRRRAALRLPGQSDTVFHLHALLRAFIDGRFVSVPAQIGIDPEGRFLAPLHTHDASGVVHDGTRRLRVYVNGRRVSDPVAHVLQAHDRIVVGYAPARSFPAVDRTPFPPGL
jgi:hypothetical protein